MIKRWKRNVAKAMTGMVVASSMVLGTFGWNVAPLISNITTAMADENEEETNCHVLHITIDGDYSEYTGIAIQGWGGIEFDGTVPVNSLSTAWGTDADSQIKVLYPIDGIVDVPYRINENDYGWNYYAGMQLLFYSQNKIKTINDNKDNFYEVIQADEVYAIFVEDEGYTLSLSDENDYYDDVQTEEEGREEYKNDIFRYALINDLYIEITDYVGNDKDVVIPEKIDGYAVTSIGAWAFSYCDDLTSIKIPSSITSIGQNAFEGCSSLGSIEIPFSVTSIGDSVFSDCDGLTSIIVSEKNEVYDNRDNCNAIIETASNTLICGCKKTIIPTSVTSIGNRAFSYCYGLKKIEIPTGVTSIGNSAFFDCYGLTNIEIPSSVTSIGCYAFEGCCSLTGMDIPLNVTSIGDLAFSGCYGLSNITVSENNKIFDSRNNCNAIIETETNTLIFGCKKTIIPSSVTSIGYCAFKGCSSLNDIDIPTSVTSIGNGAFSGCCGLNSIEIPLSVTYIGDSAFSGCSSLTRVEIPTGVTSIGYSTFSNCDGLTSVKIPTSVTCIGDEAFSGCISLTRMELPYGVTSIGDSTFSNCDRLTSIEIPSSVNDIGGYAFDSCKSLTSIEIPSSVKKIGNLAFRSCNSLINLNVSENNKKFDSRNNCNAIIETTTNTLIFGCKKTIIPSSVTSIGKGAFDACEDLTSIEIPTSVTSIGNYAFRYCSGLTSIDIPSSVTCIGDEAFYYCDGLKSIEIPTSVISIGDDVFTYCSYDLTFYCYKNSYAHQYALDNSILVKLINYHEHKVVTEKAIAATCEEDGLTEGKHCSVCGKVIKEQKVIPATGHTEVTDKAVAPTCEKSGLTEGSHCSVCDKIIKKQEVVAATGHKEVTDKAVEATCEEDGLTEGKHCSVCGKVIEEQKVIPATGHLYKTTTIKAKPGTNGSVIKTCKTCGDKITTSVIYAPKTVTLSTSSYTYNGKQRKPKVTVKDSKGKEISPSNYTVTYTNNINVGTTKRKPTVKITFKGNNYTGTMSKTFTINKAKNKLVGTASYSKTASSKAQTFKLNAKATGGKITYASDNDKIKVDSTGKVTIAKNYSGQAVITVTAGNSNYKTVTKKVTITVKPAATILKSVKNTTAKNASKGKLTVKWNKLSYVTGYQIQYSTSSSFKSGNKTVNVKGASSVSKAITGLAKNKTYYVRIRTYKTIEGKKVYSSWSAKKSVKVK